MAWQTVTDLQTMGGDHLDQPSHTSLAATQSLAKNYKHAGQDIAGKVLHVTSLGWMRDRSHDTGNKLFLLPTKLQANIPQQHHTFDNKGGLGKWKKKDVSFQTFNEEEFPRLKVLALMMLDDHGLPMTDAQHQALTTATRKLRVICKN